MIRTILPQLSSLVFLAVSSGCGPLPDPRAIYTGDLQSPIFLGTHAISETTVAISFHEPVEFLKTDFSCIPQLEVTDVVSGENSIRIAFLKAMTPGTEYAISGRVRDTSGNSLQFITKIYGFNANIPDLRVTEFTPRGSGKHPDCVEIVAVSGGNLAGVVIYEGTANEWDDRLVFPAATISSGDFIVVHFKPTGIAEEKNEVVSTNESGGYDATEGAWDYWVPAGDGLSGNNGVLTLYSSPGGSILDAVLYSNRSSASDERYRGFGSKRLLGQAEHLAQTGAWIAVDGLIRPEDAVNPDGSTGTRSICRLAGIDTDGKDDWYIVPTRGATFGASNSTAVYVP